MTSSEARLAPGTLWQSVLQSTAHGLRCGALEPLATQCTVVRDAGVDFIVRILESLARKQAVKVAQSSTTKGAGGNPFLPYEEDLFVADVSDTHLCLLNKFNAVEHHLLIVTRGFEDQEQLLTEADFAAWWLCMAEVEGLGFYNAGEIAGASQRHKHLQLVPVPLAAAGPKIPIESALATAHFDGSLGEAPALPFTHAIARLESDCWRAPRAAAKSTHGYYWEMLRRVGLRAEPSSPGQLTTGTYNLLLTREWMLLVPRARETFHDISVNALGFAGALLARDEKQLEVLKAVRPMRLLAHVGIQRTA
jgi:ATP adenylyltransferase